MRNTIDSFMRLNRKAYGKLRFLQVAISGFSQLCIFLVIDNRSVKIIDDRVNID